MFFSSQIFESMSESDQKRGSTPERKDRKFTYRLGRVGSWPASCSRRDPRYQRRRRPSFPFKRLDDLKAIKWLSATLSLARPLSLSSTRGHSEATEDDAESRSQQLTADLLQNPGRPNAPNVIYRGPFKLNLNSFSLNNEFWSKPSNYSGCEF